MGFATGFKFQLVYLKTFSAEFFKSLWRVDIILLESSS